MRYKGSKERIVVEPGMSEKNSQLSMQNSNGPIRRIAIFRALYLGDLLCAVPAFQALRQRFPEAEISLIGLPWAKELVERLPYIDRFLVFPGYPGIAEVSYRAAHTRAFLSRARVTAYDIAFQMHGDGTASNGFVAALKTRMSLGYRRGSDYRLTASLPYRHTEHEVLRWLRLVAVTGAAVNDTRTEFPTTLSEERQAAAMLGAVPTTSGPLVGLHAGGKDPARRWPPARFAALADALVEQCGACIVLTGSPAEHEITAAVRQAMRHPALDLAGRTDLGTFAAVIGQFDLLVTNDTGASHLAAAKGTRSVVLFGPSRPDRWAPLDRQRHYVIDALAAASSDMHPHQAFMSLPVELVLAASSAMLNRRQVEDHLLPAWHPLLTGTEA